MNGIGNHVDFIEGQRVMSRIGAGMANNLMDMEDGAYDFITRASSGMRTATWFTIMTAGTASRNGYAGTK